MKELYISPEMKLICFEANEKLANNEVTLDALINGGNFPGSEANGGSGVKL